MIFDRLNNYLYAHHNSIRNLYFIVLAFEIIIFSIIMFYFILIHEEESKENLNRVLNSVVAVGSILLFAVTYEYVLLTSSLVEETKKAREAQEKPSISFRIIPDEVSPTLLNISIKNSGRGSAYDIKFSFNPDPSYRETTLGKLNVFKSLSYLGAGEEIRFYFTDAFTYLNDPKSVKQFTATVTYYNHPFSRRSEHGEFKEYNEKYTVNVEQLNYLLVIDRKGVHDIAKEMEGIKESLLLIGQELVDIEHQKHKKINKTEVEAQNIPKSDIDEQNKTN